MSAPLTMKHGTVKTPPEERVPIELIAPLILSWVEKYKALHAEPNKNDRSSRYVDAEDTHHGHLEILAFHCQMSPRRLRMIKNGKFDVGGKRSETLRHVDWVPFDIADKIVCATVGPLAWRNAPLNQFYGPLPVARYERDHEHEEVAA